MSRSIMTITKWVPLETDEHRSLFVECKELKKSSEELLEKIGLFLYDFKCRNVSRIFFETCDERVVQSLEVIVEQSGKIKDDFGRVFQKLVMEAPILTVSLVQFWKYTLWKCKLKLCFFILQCVTDFVYLFIYYGEQILTLTLRLCNTFNQYLQLDTKYGLNKATTVYSNTCPYLMFPMRKLSITKILQMIAQNRAELCCHKLIDCLLETYKYDGHEEDNGSDNSSIEIYSSSSHHQFYQHFFLWHRALTRHMSPPNSVHQTPIFEKADEDIDDKGCFINMEELVQYEEQNVLALLSIAMKIAPAMLGSDGIKKLKTGETKISTRAKAKVLDYYQQILWGEVGNFLEHIVLWWGSVPLSSRPPHSSQHLREWINQFAPTADVPPFILSAISCLSDALGVHVTSTSWDQHFRLALVASKTANNQDTGRFFCEMLHDLVMLCNQCEVTSEWIIGAPLEELPLVEQIPVLHRLDHSVHTTRLWAISETKKLANNWNVESFFLITHCDIVNGLSQLNDLRVADHTLEIEKGKLGVHVQVCANMREKLVSEVKGNIQKLKEAPNQCVDCLAKICRTISLANLKMIFPKRTVWKITGPDYPNTPSVYVEKYLDQILMPVLETTDDHQISNMILRIMCECWLDHIYIHKVKFSQRGALQLLTDFAFVGNWIVNCPTISQDMRKKMLKNEVLRRCEGVGRLLLRSPGEHIKMNDKTKKPDPEQSPKSENTELMPAEMYVPNQEQWLELRATRKSVFLTTLCCDDMNVTN